MKASDTPSRKPHDGWLNAWLYKWEKDHQFRQNLGYLWNNEVRQMAGDWADFKLTEAERLQGELLAALKN